MSAPLHLFEGYGIELEYMIVDRSTLDVLPVADELLRGPSGVEMEIDSPATAGRTAWSNELVLHVIELKTNGPASSLVGLSELFETDVRAIDAQLAARGGMLLPGGMHPWMDPNAEMRLWPHQEESGAGARIYETFHRIFDCRGHGWANLQSVHLNLPFHGDDEFGALHAAIRLVLPILPALAASSPLRDGVATGLLDTRLDVYRSNCRRVPSVTGHVVPEPVFRKVDYEEQVLGRIYRDIAPLDPEAVLRHEWLNARGAIARFDRDAIEIRVLDVQECPRADIAICALITAVLRALVGERWSSGAAQRAWASEPLRDLLQSAMRDAEQTVVSDADYLAMFGRGPAPITLQDLWRELAAETLAAGDPSLEALEPILREGPLARRILAALGGSSERARVLEVYRELAACLEAGRPFLPHSSGKAGPPQ